MGTVDLLLVVLLVVASALCAVAIWALFDMVKTSRSVRGLTDDTRERIVPLLDKADVTVDAANAELLRVDAIITQVEQASSRVSHASETITEIVNTPAEIVNNVAGAVRRAWKDKRQADKVAAVERDADSEPGDPAEAQSTSSKLMPIRLTMAAAVMRTVRACSPRAGTVRVMRSLAICPPVLP